MKKEMTVRERMLCVYNNESPDKIPLGIYSGYLPRGQIEREVREKGLGIIDFYPVVSMMAPPWHIGSGMLSEVKGAEMDIRYRWENGKMTERRSFVTPVGTIYQEVCQDKNGVGSEHISKHYISDSEDYKIMQYLVENTVFRKNEETLKARTRDLGEDGIVLGRIDRSPYQKCLIELAGAERFLVDLYTEPEPVLELLDAMGRKMDQAFEMMLESDIDVIWQPDNVTSDMTPPDNYEKFCMPLYNKYAEGIHGTGKRYVVHMDGRIKALCEKINQSGFDVIESLSFPEIGGDYSMTEALAAFPGKAIAPNFPSNLCNESDADIELYLRRLIGEIGAAPVMLQVSEDIPVGEWQRVLPLLVKVFGE